MVRYHIEPLKGTALPLGAEDLAADLAVAERLLDSPPEYSPGGPWDAPAAVAATALEASIISGAELPAEALRFAAETVIRIGEGAVEPHPVRQRGAHTSNKAPTAARHARFPCSSCRTRRRSAPAWTAGTGLKRTRARPRRRAASPGPWPTRSG